MSGSSGELPPWFDEEKHEVDPETGVIKKKGYLVMKGDDLVQVGHDLVMEKIERVEKETKEKEGKK